MATKKYALEWDAQGQKQYEMGVSHGVLYKYDKTSQKWLGVAWNGLISVTESPDGAEETELWADIIKYGSLRSAELNRDFVVSALRVSDEVIWPRVNHIDVGIVGIGVTTGEGDDVLGLCLQGGERSKQQRYCP